MQQQSISNKLFTFEGIDDSGCPIYSPAPQVQQVCQVVDGFIYVANAETGRGKIREPFYFFFFCTSAATIAHHARCLLSPKSSTQNISLKKKTLSSTAEGESDVAHIRAVLSSGGGSASRPLLVLACVSREEPAAVRTTSLQTVTSRNRARCRTPCVDMAKRLGLPQVANPWMVILFYLIN